MVVDQGPSRRLWPSDSAQEPRNLELELPGLGLLSAPCGMAQGEPRGAREACVRATEADCPRDWA